MTLLFAGLAPLGHTLLFAVDARPPHDGVRKARRLNLFHDFAGFRPQFETLNEIALPIVPKGPIRIILSSESFVLCSPFCQFRRAPSVHMRCRMTARLRATATRARAMPRCLAIFMPQARSEDHLRLRVISVSAVS